MKKLSAKLFALATTLLMSLTLQAAQFEEGTNYKVLDLPHTDQPTVTEFFSFYCPHCFKFESVLEQLQKQLPTGTIFQKSHVSFMGGDMGIPMSKAYATMVSLNIENKMVPVMFDRIHIKRQPPKDNSELRSIFTNEGVDGTKFDDAFNSFAVDSMVRRFDQEFNDSGLTCVPSVVVNGKYLVQAQGLKSINEYFELVDYLLTL
jgi:protein dithiol oxidoreductase (disulfide-forming)